MHKTHSRLTALRGEVLRPIYPILVKIMWKIVVGIQHDVRKKHVLVEEVLPLSVTLYQRLNHLPNFIL